MFRCVGVQNVGGSKNFGGQNSLWVNNFGGSKMLGGQHFLGFNIFWGVNIFERSLTLPSWTCAPKNLLVLMGGRAEGQACADP